MFVAGALVVGGVIIAHDNHSNYSDYHSRHSQYGDASLVAEIRAKEAKLNEKKAEIGHIRTELENRYNESLQILKNEDALKDIVKDVEGRIDIKENSIKFKEQVIADFQQELMDEVEADKEQLKRIDEAIMRINSLQLSNKVKNNVTTHDKKK